mgnify:CR=1 FL=1
MLNECNKYAIFPDDKEYGLPTDEDKRNWMDGKNENILGGYIPKLFISKEEVEVRPIIDIDEIGKNNSSESEVEKERNRILKEMEEKWPYKITQESNGSRYDFIFMKDMQRIILNIGEDGEPLDYEEKYPELKSHEI